MAILVFGRYPTGMGKMRYEFRPVAACDMCAGHSFAMLGMRLSSSQGIRPRRAEGIAVSVKQCSDCGLIFADPQPIPGDMSDHYGLPPENYWNAVDFRWSPEYFRTEIDTANRLLGFKTGMRALDIGIGLGKAMKSLAAAGFEAYGIEPSAAFREKAIEAMGLDPGCVQQAPVEQAEFAEGRFDFITFGAVLEHLTSPSLAIKRALRWVKPHGIVHAEVPSSRWLVARIVNSWFRVMGTNYVTHLSPMHPPFHLYEFDMRSFERNGARLGYEVAHQHHMTCVVPHLPLKPLFRRIMDLTNTGMQVSVYLRRI